MIGGERARRVGLALTLVGLGAAIISTGIEDRPAARVGADAPVNAGARDPGDISANNSPTLARDPRRPERLAVVNRIDSPRYSCALNVSGDGGRRWTRVRVPIPPGEEPKCFAPDAAFAADGTLHVSYVTLKGTGNVPNAVWLVRSRDGGRTLSAPRRVGGRLTFQVRIAADPARAGRVYLTWLQAEEVGLYRFASPGNPIVVLRSEDGGATWSRPVRASDPARSRVVAPAPAVGPRGELYVLFLDLRDDRLDYEGAHEGFGGPPYDGRFALVLGRSRDGGRTWEESVVEDRVVPTTRFIAFLPPFPSIAVDRRSGRIYAAFQDGRLGRSDVWLWSLARGASGWTGPTRINDTPERDGTTQELPKVAVAPDGRVDVVYYDRRDDRRDRATGVSLQTSYDEGATFSERAVLTSRAFDSRIGAGGERGLPDLGSRLGLVSGESEALAVWTDTRAGTEASNKQDIAFARATLSRPGRTGRLALRYGGAAVAVAGLALMLLAARRRYLSGSPTDR
jgi:hypothetical protein